MSSNKIQSGGITLQQQSPEDMLLVEAYGEGGFRFLGRRVEGATLLFPDGFFPMASQTLSDLNEADFDKVLNAPEKPEILLIGTGDKMQLLPAAIRAFLEKHNIGFDIMDTGAAARTYNVLMMEGRRVAALLLPVD